MKSIVDDVKAFHEACDVPVLNETYLPEGLRRVLRYDLIDEEINKELLPAMLRDDLVGIADGLADAIYVLVGTALEYGIPLEKVWDEVHASNMRKVDPQTGKVLKRADGKVIKGPNWTPPDITGLLIEAGMV